MRIRATEHVGASGRRIPDGPTVHAGKEVDVPDGIGEEMIKSRYFEQVTPSKARSKAKAKAKGGAKAAGAVAGKGGEG